jgi:drug/metabolite transporter (DMT)-like permease
MLACMFWGLSFPVSKTLTLLYLQSFDGASSWFVVCLQGSVRFLLAGLLMAPFAWRELGNLRRREVVQGLGLAVCATAGLLFQMDGLAYTSASVSAFLTQAYCVLLPLYHSSRTRTLPASRDLIAVLMVIAGITVLANVDWKTFRIGRGELETLVSAAFFTGQILWLERPVFRQNRTRVVSTLMFLSIGLIFGLGCLGIQPTRVNYAAALDSFPKIFLTLVLVLLCTLCAFNLMNRYQPEITSIEAGIVYTAEPLFAALFALFLPAQLDLLAHVHYPNEAFSLTVLSGGGLILAANLLLQIGSRQTVPTVPEIGMSS